MASKLFVYEADLNFSGINDVFLPGGRRGNAGDDFQFHHFFDGFRDAFGGGDVAVQKGVKAVQIHGRLTAGRRRRRGFRRRGRFRSGWRRRGIGMRARRRRGVAADKGLG